MKKTVLILIAAAVLLSLAACGGNNSSEKDVPPTPAVTPASAVPDKGTPPAADTAEPTDGDISEPGAEPTPTAEPTPSTTPVQAESDPVETSGGGQTQQASKELAEEYIGKTTEELYAAIGEPNSSDYAPSCLGDGEDGNLYYDDFTVYTYRENETETVEYVE